MKLLRTCAVVSVGALSSVALAGIAQAAPGGPRAENGTAALVHVGTNPATCGQSTGTVSGVVNTHTNLVQNRREINIAVRGAKPDTTYQVDIRCEVARIGTLTTNSRGTGTAHIDLSGSTWPANPYYIDLSIPHGGTGAGHYGDTFIAGPFSG